MGAGCWGAACAASVCWLIGCAKTSSSSVTEAAMAASRTQLPTSPLASKSTPSQCCRAGVISIPSKQPVSVCLSSHGAVGAKQAYRLSVL